MTTEQKISRGTVIIFLLSILLLLCLCTTAVLAYFAGSQTANTTLIMGGPVRVSMVNKDFEETYGEGDLVMNLKSSRQELLPGMGIDMQAIAKITSSDVNSTRALLRAILDLKITGLSDALAKEVEIQIREALGKCLTSRIDSAQDDARPGWVKFDDDNYYYCSQYKEVDEITGQEYLVLAPIEADSSGNNITFINGTFQFPYKAYTNKYADIEIEFSLKFQAIQEQLTDDNGNRIPNSIFNVKSVLDKVDWDKHNN